MNEFISFSPTLSVGYLVGATDPDVIEIFARINTVSKALNPQEKQASQTIVAHLSNSVSLRQ